MSGQRPHLGRIGIWAGELDNCTAADAREAVTTIEDLGFGTLWFPETAGREAMAQAGILLSQTRRIVVAAGSADIYARDAVTAAAAQLTLEEAFPGRFLLGLWDSHPSLAGDIRGHRFGPPVPTMRAYLDALDAAHAAVAGARGTPPALKRRGSFAEQQRRCLACRAVMSLRASLGTVLSSPARAPRVRPLASAGLSPSTRARQDGVQTGRRSIGPRLRLRTSRHRRLPGLDHPQQA